MNKKIRLELIAGPWDGDFLYVTGGDTLVFSVGQFRGFYRTSYVMTGTMFWVPA